MRTIIILSFFLSIALSYIYTIPCGRCVGRGDVCHHDQCGPDLKCTSLPTGGAPVCLPAIGKGKKCDQIEDYDPCENGFTCDKTDTLVCIPSSAFAEYNDGCEDDDYCKNGLSCKNGLCKETNFTECRADVACPRNKHCEIPTGQGFNAVGTCVANPGLDQDCSNHTCKQGLFCQLDQIRNTRKCKAYYTSGGNTNCTSDRECSTGLSCFQDVVLKKSYCKKPTYTLIGGLDTDIWNYECIPPKSGASGCYCNTRVKVYQYYKESITTDSEACQNGYKNYMNCLDTNACKENTGSGSCLRKYCYEAMKGYYRACGSTAEFCGATSISIMILLVILALLVV
jgi:hypothetical protein